MTVNLSALAGAGAQFFDNNGVILSGGKLYSYAAGTTTPQTTYTSASGATAHTNPIILNSAGRVATGEIWLTTGSNYKFVLYTSTDVLIATWDNITGINGTGIATAAVNVSFTGFKGQTGTVQDLADDDGSDWIGFKQAGTNAVARSAQDKMRESVSVKDFGAIGDGVADDTAAIQAAIDTGSSVFIPSGTYKTTSSLNVTTNNQQITGGGNAKIVGSYEQDPVSPNANESMIFVDGADNVTIKNITLEYTGTFSVGGPTVSYGGYVSCIQVEDCDDFTAENVIAYGANRSGINVGYMLTGTPPYCARPKILNCYLHHNRVGGVTLGNTNEAIVRGCSLTFNGNDPDGGTGYGFAAWAACEPIDTLVDGNQANDNYRKGIDFHAGLNGIVSNNVCARNRIYGIYVMSNRGAFTISNNLVTEMTGPNPFNLAIYGIRVGGLVGQGLSEIPTSYVLDGNVINEFNLTSGVDGFPLADAMTGCSYGSLTISNNIIDVGSVGAIHNSAANAGIGPDGNYYDVNFSNNQIYAKSCTQTLQPILFRGSNNRQKIFCNNNVNIANVTGTSGIVAHAVTSITNRCFIANGNNIVAPDSGWSSINEPIQVRRVTSETQTGNIVNGVAWRDWDGYKFIFFTSAAAPTTNFWSQGSIVWKNNVAALGTPGYICTTAGTPGTWSAMASLV